MYNDKMEAKSRDRTDAQIEAERREKLEKIIEKTLYYEHENDSSRIEFLKHRYESMEE